MVLHNIRPRPNRKPLAVLAEPKSVFTVVKLTTTRSEGGDEVGVEAPTVSVRGIHPTEEQAYAAALLDLIYSLEVEEGNVLPKVRAIAKTKTLPAKDRLKSIQSCQDPEAAERVEFLVRRSNVFPEEEGEKGGTDMESLLEGPLMPCTLWDSDDDEEDYAPSSSSDSEDEEVEEDEEMELVDERDVFEGVEGSGTKGKEEEEAAQA
jgi:hypothetical protein